MKGDRMVFGWLYDNRTDFPYRPATAGEQAQSEAAVSKDNPRGVFIPADGVPVYVAGSPAEPVLPDTGQ
jgi:hypothetical protein